ncbi:hypothetical protein EMPS_08095 [Entomortierella parvispora]|uniref:Uncharacterized protein n=1 Tax=Entomortierella parvispora TaxID=205924 RepID=A0A9P3HG84_9FUNG|nr:hypothetical protein EMPS_08095 [Entomortierella parvispora]
MPPVRVLSLNQVHVALDALDTEDILASQAKAFHSYSANQTQTPQRSTLQTDNHSTLIMPSRIDTQTSVIKVVSVPKKDSKNGLPGVTLVMDNETGEPRGLVNARLLTALRTAAGSALATRAVFSAKYNNDNNKGREGHVNYGERSLTLVIFGSGAQAKAHIQLLIHILPQIKTVVICNRTLPRAQELIQELAPKYNQQVDFWAFSISTGESTPRAMTTITMAVNSSIPQQHEPTLELIVSSADIICTCTNSKEALFKGDWVQPGTHINMVGSFKPDMHEVDQTLIQRAFTMVDARRECEEEAGELILARKESGYDGILAELGQLFDEQGTLDVQKIPSEFGSLTWTASSLGQPRSPIATVASKSMSASTMISSKDVSIFKSVGIAAQDVAITALVLDKAELMGLGNVVDI